MSDYRDDRPALRQRIETLEAELSESKERVTELEERLRAPREKKPSRFIKPPLSAIAIVALVVVAMGVVTGLWLRNPSRVPRPPPPTPPKPLARSPELTPPPRVSSMSCRCNPDTEAVALSYRASTTMSLGGNNTYTLDLGLRVVGPAGVREIDLAPNVQTAPPSSFQGGTGRLLLACLDDRMVLALGHRASAWAFSDGRQLWSATLPVPVGEQKNGPLTLECDRLEVKDGVITVPHAGGGTKLSAERGAETP